ncbi:MAG TPA: helix-turn-helix transcriptional regulator [Candidatus Ornithoclostridium faecigallinarum]|nr:helix-turn-helix transcriptional regulator [Candidatus Ornithoclostridium faecigallinarum]
MEISFASNVRAMRENSRLTQQQLADKLSVTQRKVSYWESGKIEPDLESLWKLADFFDVTIDELVGRQ